MRKEADLLGLPPSLLLGRLAALHVPLEQPPLARVPVSRLGQRRVVLRGPPVPLRRLWAWQGLVGVMGGGRGLGEGVRVTALRRVGGWRVGGCVGGGLGVHLIHRLRRRLEGGAGSPRLHVLLFRGLLVSGVSEAVALPSARVWRFFRVGAGVVGLRHLGRPLPPDHLPVAHVLLLAHVRGVMAGVALAG